MQNRLPLYDVNTFECPTCGAYARQIWRHYSFQGNVEGVSTRLIDNQHTNPGAMTPATLRQEENLSIALCSNCEEHSVWLNKHMISPLLSTAPLPTNNMPINVLIDYNEARKIFLTSPRSAAALLRLSVQKLCVNLGGKGENINQDIKYLVQDGLPNKIQKALDIVRVIGNNAVHPGQIDINDNPEIANALFAMINLIVDTMITEPLEIERVYDLLPESSKEQIDTRDSKEA